MGNELAGVIASSTIKARIVPGLASIIALLIGPSATASAWAEWVSSTFTFTFSLPLSRCSILSYESGVHLRLSGSLFCLDLNQHVVVVVAKARMLFISDHLADSSIGCWKGILEHGD